MPQALYFCDPSVCCRLGGTTQQNARGLVGLRHLNPISDDRLWEDSIGYHVWLFGVSERKAQRAIEKAIIQFDDRVGRVGASLNKEKQGSHRERLQVSNFIQTPLGHRS